MEMKKLVINGVEYTVDDPDAVAYAAQSDRTDAQKAQARKNIGGAREPLVVEYDEQAERASQPSASIYAYVQSGGDVYLYINHTYLKLSYASEGSAYFVYSTDEAGVTVYEITQDGTLFLTEHPIAACGFDALAKKEMVDKLAPAFCESGSVVSCQPVEGYPLNVVAYGTPESWAVVENAITPLAQNAANAETFFTSVLSSGKTYRLTVNATDADGAQVQLSQACVVYLRDEGYTQVAATISDNHIDFLVTKDIDVEIQLSYEDSVDVNSLYDIIEGGESGVDTFTLKDGALVLEEYTPAVNATKIYRAGKNLLPYPYYEEQSDRNGVAFQVNDDGSVTITGETTNPFNSYIELVRGLQQLKHGVTYCLPPTQDNVQFRFSYADGEGATVSTKGPVTWNEKYSALSIFIVISATGAVDKTVYPQLEVGETATPYQQYRGGAFAAGDEIPALAGVNTVWADNGEITVTGRADPIAIIEKQQTAISSVLDRVAALEAAAVSSV